jgi:hypothetical protein
MPLLRFWTERPLAGLSKSVSEARPQTEDTDFTKRHESFQTWFGRVSMRLLF